MYAEENSSENCKFGIWMHFTIIVNEFNADDDQFYTCIIILFAWILCYFYLSFNLNKNAGITI